MAIVRTIGEEDYAAVTYAPPTYELMDRIAQQFDGLSERLTERGRAFMDRAREYVEQYDIDGIRRRAQAFTRTITNMWAPNQISLLEDIGALQHAQPVMQRWLMANPRYRREVHRGRAAGWRETYIDLEPDYVGEEHSDYRRVMNGMLRTTEQGHEYYTTYPDVYENGVEELELCDKSNLLASWELTNWYLDEGDSDPGDPYNGKL